MLTAYPFVNFDWKDATGHIPLKTNVSSNGYNTLSENNTIPTTTRVWRSSRTSTSITNSRLS
jgi:hypothetical protein